jgi:hypothetical protein
MWRWVVFGVTALLLLALPSAASAKQVNRIFVVDSTGRSIDLGGGWPLYSQLRPTGAAPAAAPGGSYLLLFPLMERGVPMQPGRYFTDSHVVCWSWALSVEGCVTVEQLPPSWALTRTLAPFAREPTTLRALSHGAGSYTVPSNGTVGIELALSRPSLSRRAPRAACAWRLHAQWQGPAALDRPRSLCLRTRGISSGRVLYPLSRAVVQMLHLVS